MVVAWKESQYINWHVTWIIMISRVSQRERGQIRGGGGGDFKKVPLGENKQKLWNVIL